MSRPDASLVTLDISLGERIVAKILTNRLDLGLVSHEAYDPRLFASFSAICKDYLQELLREAQH